MPDIFDELKKKEDVFDTVNVEPTMEQLRAQAIKEHPQTMYEYPVEETKLPSEGALAIDPTSTFAWGMGAVQLPAIGVWGKILSGFGAKSTEAAKVAKTPITETLVGKTAEALRHVSPQEVAKSSILPLTGKTVSEVYKEAEQPIVTSIARTQKKTATEMNKPEVLAGIQDIIDKEKTAMAAEGRTIPKQSVTQLSEAEKFKAPLLQPKPSNELEKINFDILKDESGAINLQALQSPIERLRGQIRSGLEWVQSPYYVLGKDTTGSGMMIYRRLEEADRAKAMFLNKMRTERMQNIKIIPDSPQSDNVGRLLDEYATEYDIPAYKWGILSQSEKDAFRFYRQKWDEAADLLISKGILDKKRRIKEYLFRVFDKDTVYNAAKNEYAFAMNELATGGMEAKQTATLKERVDKLKLMINAYEKTGTILYDYIPKELNIPFLKPRTGAEGYSVDVVRAYDIYEQYLAKKLFDEPAIKEASEFLKTIPPEQREYARKFMRRFIGLERPPAINNLLRTFTAFEYFKDMGFNVRSAMVNATQNINTIVDIGPKWTAEGAWRAMFDPEAKAVWRASGHAQDVPSLRYGLVSKTAESFGKYPWYLFDKAETANRATAYIGGYYKALNEGKSPAMAKVYADDIVRRTQFMYGRVGSPQALQSPGGPVMMQFSTFSIKQLEFLTTLFREDKKKFLAYMLIANGLNEGTKELGIDFSNTLGIGVDFRELYTAMKDLSKGEPTAAWIHTQLGLPKIPGLNIGTAGSGIFPSGIAPMLDTVAGTVKGEWEKTLIPTEAQRLYQSFQAFKEGQIYGAYPGEEMKMEKGYPVRDIRTGYLKSLESPTQLVMRAIGPKPAVEGREYVEMRRAQITEDTRKKLSQDALIAWGKGNEKEFYRLQSKYNLDFSEQDFQSLYLNRFTTPVMRKRVEELRSQKDMLFKKSIGEPILPNMP